MKYNAEEKNWRKSGSGWRTKTDYTQVCSKKREILWMNFDPGGQMSLF